MSPTAGNGNSKPPQTLTSRIMGAFTGPPSAGRSDADETPEVLPAGERKAAMSTLNEQEVKWALGGLILAALAGIGIPTVLPHREPPYEAGREVCRCLS